MYEIIFILLCAEEILNYIMSKLRCIEILLTMLTLLYCDINNVGVHSNTNVMKQKCINIKQTFKCSY